MIVVGLLNVSSFNNHFLLCKCVFDDILPQRYIKMHFTYYEHDAKFTVTFQ
jgi:hypothetical protein